MIIQLSFLKGDEFYFKPNVVDVISGSNLFSFLIIESYSHTPAWLYGGQSVLS